LERSSRIDEYEDVGDAGGSIGTSVGWNSSNNTEELDIDCDLCLLPPDSH